MAESEEALQLKRRARRRLIGAIALMCFVVIILPLLLDKEPGPAGPPLDVQIPKQDQGGISARIGPSAVQAPALTEPAPVPEKKIETAPAQAAAPAASDDAPASKAAPSAPKSADPVAKSEPSAAKAAPAKAEATKTEAVKTETTKAESAKPEPAAGNAAEDASPNVNKAEQERAQAALRDEAWVVSLDAFSDMKNVKLLRAKLSAAGVKSYTEPVKTSKGELTRVRAGPFTSKEAAEKARAKLETMGLKPGAVASR
jgi:DedD protein